MGHISIFKPNNLTKFCCLIILLFLKAEFKARRQSECEKCCYQDIARMLGLYKTKITWCLKLKYLISNQNQRSLQTLKLNLKKAPKA